MAVHTMRVRRLGIDTHQQAVVYMRQDCPVCRSEGFAAEARVAGAPGDPAAGLALHAPLGAAVAAGDPLFTLHADSPGELAYALDFVNAHPSIVALEAPP